MSPSPDRPRRQREPDPYHGILLVDKPGGWTSHDVVAKVRNHFRFNKVGHGGTLDPMATGLLVLLIGNGTRISNLVMGGDKTYEGVIRLGIATDTQDAEGRAIETHDASAVSREQVEAVVRNYIGDIEQLPPMVSAIKKDGVPLYKLARKGQEIEREPRKIHIASFDVLGFDNPDIAFRVRSSKGTYVRTLAHDIGRDLGVGGHLLALRRTASGPLKVEQASALEQILACDRASIGGRIISLASMMS